MRATDSTGMTLKQSQTNIEKLKNTASAFTEEWVVHFEFSSESEFEIKFFKKKNWKGEMLLILDKHQEDRLPFGRMYAKNEHIHFLYQDSIYHFYSCNITLDLVEDSYIMSARLAEYELYRALRSVPGFEKFKIRED